MTRGGVQPIDQRVKRRRKGRRECRWRRLVRQLAMKGHGSALYAAGSEAYLGHMLCSVHAASSHHHLLDRLFVFPSSFRRPRYRAIHERLSMNERAARHEVITLGTAEGSQGEGETRKKSLT